MTEQYIRYAAMFIIIMMAVIDDYRRFKVSNRIIIAGMVIGVVINMGIGVCKYQPAYQLLGSITRQRPDRTQRVEDITRYIGVYGFNSTLRVTLAMVIAAAYSKKGRTLFINLDEFSGIEHIMMSDGCSNLSDVFYMFKQAGEHFTQQIRECIKANELFDYIPAVVCADDISYVNDRLISGLLDELAHNLKYDYIVVNISEGINKPWSIMGRCSNVYISDSGDYIENCRFNNLKRYFIESGKEAIVDRMMRINLKMKDTMDEGFLKRIMYTDAYGYVSSLLDMV